MCGVCETPKKQKITPLKDYKNLDLPILGLKTITGRCPHEFSEFWRSHPVRGVVSEEGIDVGLRTIGSSTTIPPYHQGYLWYHRTSFCSIGRLL